MVALLVFILLWRYFLAKINNCWTDKVHLAITLSKIRLDIHAHIPYSRTELMIKLFQ